MVFFHPPLPLYLWYWWPERGVEMVHTLNCHLEICCHESDCLNKLTVYTPVCFIYNESGALQIALLTSLFFRLSDGNLNYIPLLFKCFTVITCSGIDQTMVLSNDWSFLILWKHCWLTKSHRKCQQCTVWEETQKPDIAAVILFEDVRPTKWWVFIWLSSGS